MLIRTEQTPNPATRKFLPEQIVMEGSTRDFPFLWVQLPNYGRPDSVPTASGARSSSAVAMLPNVSAVRASQVRVSRAFIPRNMDHLAR